MRSKKFLKSNSLFMFKLLPVNPHVSLCCSFSSRECSESVSKTGAHWNKPFFFGRWGEIDGSRNHQYMWRSWTMFLAKKYFSQCSRLVWNASINISVGRSLRIFIGIKQYTELNGLNQKCWKVQHNLRRKRDLPVFVQMSNITKVTRIIIMCLSRFLSLLHSPHQMYVFFHCPNC